jgi:iron complex transport system substrate-binding protein
MTREPTKGRTRRDVIRRSGSAVIGAGLLAGCTGSGGSGAGGTTDSGGGKTVGGETNDPNGTTASGGGENATGSSGSYEACMKPVGCLSFESVPEELVVYHQGWVDIALSLG